LPVQPAASNRVAAASNLAATHRIALRRQQQPLQLALSMKESAGDGAMALAPVSLGMPMSARCGTERRKVDAH